MAGIKGKRLGLWILLWFPFRGHGEHQILLPWRKRVISDPAFHVVEKLIGGHWWGIGFSLQFLGIRSDEVQCPRWASFSLSQADLEWALAGDFFYFPQITALSAANSTFLYMHCWGQIALAAIIVVGLRATWTNALDSSRVEFLPYRLTGSAATVVNCDFGWVVRRVTLGDNLQGR